MKLRIVKLAVALLAYHLHLHVLQVQAAGRRPPADSRGANVTAHNNIKNVVLLV